MTEQTCYTAHNAFFMFKMGYPNTGIVFWKIIGLQKALMTLHVKESQNKCLDKTWEKGDDWEFQVSIIAWTINIIVTYHCTFPLLALELLE